MDPGKLVFAQLMEFLPRHDFNACVRRYGGDRRPQASRAGINSSASRLPN